MWVEKTLLSIHVKLWDVKRRLLSYLEEMAVGNPVGNAESVARQVTTAVMLDLEDRDFQQNICINTVKNVNRRKRNSRTQLQPYPEANELPSGLGLNQL